MITKISSPYNFAFAPNYKNIFTPQISLICFLENLLFDNNSLIIIVTIPDIRYPFNSKYSGFSFRDLQENLNIIIDHTERKVFYTNNFNKSDNEDTFILRGRKLKLQ